MLHPTSLILLPLVVLVSLVFDISEAGPLTQGHRTQDELKCPEYKELTKKLETQSDDLEKLISDYRKKLAADNDLLQAVKSYRKVYVSAQGTQCVGMVPPNEDNDDNLMMSFIADCDRALPKDDVTAFTNKIAVAKDKVKEVDYRVDYTCNHDSENCNSEKEEATEKLKSITSPEFDEELKSDAKAVLEKFQTNLDECFKSGTAKLLDELVKDTAATNTCLSKKSSFVIFYS